MKRFADWLIARAQRREPDFIVGGREHPYLLRWWLIPRNRFFNIYLHKFLRDDDDRALHDHPWAWCSILLRGKYVEHTIAPGGIHRRQLRTAGTVKFALPSKAHRIELLVDGEGYSIPCWTVFITGPRVRQWGFHCPERGWVHWQDFVAADDVGAVGRGCGEP